MNRTKRLEITVETNELIGVTRLSTPIQAWCRDCDKVVRLITPEEAAALAGVSWREIARRVESGRVHFTENTGWRLLICIDSLSA